MKRFTTQAAVVAIVCTLCLLSPAHPAPTISTSLLQLLHSPAGAPNGRANILLSMTKGSPREALDRLKLKSFGSRSEKLNAVAATLQSEADRSQANVLNFLAEQKSSSNQHTVKQLWISNQIIVRDADSNLIRELSKMADISKIEQEQLVPFEEMFGTKKPVQNGGKQGAGILEDQWGVVAIEAAAVWDHPNGTRGEGVVVGHLDTGARLTHEALRDSYRGGNYSWFAPYEYSEEPTDVEDHGTHTMATILGSTRGVGVAPGAKWMTCKMCYYGPEPQCSDFALLECGQFLACPTRFDGSDPDCSQAPHIVSNSWGWNSSPWYDDVINAWRAGGLIPIFSMGNNGPSCQSTGYPGNTPWVIAVGSTTSDNDLSYFSSVGPSPEGLRKPDVAAPGSDVFSALSQSDTQYGFLSGTSMACPHAAGVAALLLSHKPDLEFDDIKSLLEGGAVPINAGGSACGGIEDSVYPNNHAGHGLIDALNSYKNLLEQEQNL